MAGLIHFALLGTVLVAAPHLADAGTGRFYGLSGSSSFMSQVAAEFSLTTTMATHRYTAA